MQTVEQPELLLRASQAIARCDEDALRQRHSHARVEIPLEYSVIASRLVAIIALRQQRGRSRRRRAHGVAEGVRERMAEQHERLVVVNDGVESPIASAMFPAEDSAAMPSPRHDEYMSIECDMWGLQTFSSESAIAAESVTARPEVVGAVASVSFDIPGMAWSGCCASALEAPTTRLAHRASFAARETGTAWILITPDYCRAEKPRFYRCVRAGQRLSKVR